MRTPTVSRLLTKTDIRHLNRARTIQARVGRVASARAWEAAREGEEPRTTVGLARTAERAESADYELFQLLLVADSTGTVDLTAAQLHNRKPDDAE